MNRKLMESILLELRYSSEDNEVRKFIGFRKASSKMSFIVDDYGVYFMTSGFNGRILFNDIDSWELDEDVSICRFDVGESRLVIL